MELNRMNWMNANTASDLSGSKLERLQCVAWLHAVQKTDNRVNEWLTHAPQ